MKTLHDLDTLNTHIEDFLEKAQLDRTEKQIMDVYVRALNEFSKYKITSPEAKALKQFQDDLLKLRKKRFPKAAKPIEVKPDNGLSPMDWPDTNNSSDESDD